MSKLLLLLIAGTAAQDNIPSVGSNGGDVYVQVSEANTIRMDIGSKSYNMGQELPKLKTIFNTSGLATVQGGIIKIPVGMVNSEDAPQMNFVLSGCKNDKYTATVFFSASANANIAHIVSSTFANDDSATVKFSDYLTILAGTQVANRLVLSVTVDTSNIDSSCNTFSYSVKLTSMIGEMTEVTSQDIVTGVPVLVKHLSTEDSLMTVASTLESVVAQQLSLVQQLSNATKEISDLKNITSPIQGLTLQVALMRDLLDNITGCHGIGELLQPDGTCAHPLPICAVPPGTQLSFDGVATPGTLADVGGCDAGSYNAGKQAQCLRNGSWTNLTPDCKKCQIANCDECSSQNYCTKCSASYQHLNNGACSKNGKNQANAVNSCMDIKNLNFDSGYYYVKSAAGRVYRTYCFNSAAEGWTDAQDGGWEVVYSQIGGNKLPNPSKSFASMRASPTTNDAITMPNLYSGNKSTHKSQLSLAFSELSKQKGVTWIKLMAKIYLDETKGQDAFVMEFDNDNYLDFLFSNLPNGGNVCKRMPSQVKLTVNGAYMGSTSYVYYRSSDSIGFASSTDRCGQNEHNYITSSGRSSFRRINVGESTDNTIRHLIAYADRKTGRDSSRCNYCCWGCTDWREVVLLAAREN